MPSTTPRCRAWLCFVLSAALLSVVLAQEQKPANADADAKARQEQKRPDPVAAEQTRPTAINTMPFIELAERGRMMVEAGRLGPETTFDLSATAELNEDGSFKPESVKIEWRAPADEEVALLAQQLLTAISQSKILGVLRGYAKTVHLTTRLDRENVALGLEAEVASETDAMKMADGYGALLLMARINKKGTPEATLYEAVKVTSEGRVFRATFQIPKVTAAKMVADMLDKRAARGAAPNQD